MKYTISLSNHYTPHEFRRDGHPLTATCDSDGNYLPRYYGMRKAAEEAAVQLLLDDPRDGDYVEVVEFDELTEQYGDCVLFKECDLAE